MKPTELKEIALHITIKAMEKDVISFGNENEAVKNIADFYKGIYSELSAPAEKPAYKSLPRLKARSYN